MATIQEDILELDEQIAEGRFGPLLDWLRSCVHRHGRTLEAPDLLEHTTGETISQTRGFSMSSTSLVRSAICSKGQKAGLGSGEAVNPPGWDREGYFVSLGVSERNHLSTWKTEVNQDLLSE